MTEGDPSDRDAGRTGESLDDRLNSLERRLEAQRREEDAKTVRPKSSSGGFAEALKLGSEFVAGVLVGAAIGYGIDRLFGTAPFGMIVFLLLGFAAGVLNVLRSQGVVAEPGERLKRRGDGDRTGGSGS